MCALALSHTPNPSLINSFRSPHTNLTNLHGHHQDPPWQAAVNEGNIKSLMKLRWANLGLNYIWSIRQYAQYDKKKLPSLLSSASPATAGEAPPGGGGIMPIPNKLKELARAVSSPVGFNSLAPEAGIVNYYPADAMMGGTWRCGLFHCQ